MTNEEYKLKMQELDKINKGLEEQENELNRQIKVIRDKQKEIYRQKWDLEGEYAEAVTGFKVGEVVNVTRYNNSKSFKMIIDKMYVDVVEAGPRCLYVCGRKVTKLGIPGKNGYTEANVFFNEGTLHSDKIEHIN